jgi:hypothetical protein
MQNPVGLHLHIYETAPGVVEAMYTAPEHFQGYPGVLHGGIVGALIDDQDAPMDPSANPRSCIQRLEQVPPNVPIAQTFKGGKSRTAWRKSLAHAVSTADSANSCRR